MSVDLLPMPMRTLWARQPANCLGDRNRAGCQFEDNPVDCELFDELNDGRRKPPATALLQAGRQRLIAVPNGIGLNHRDRVDVAQPRGNPLFAEGMDRSQTTLFPVSPGSWVDEDNPARVIDASI
jgi:hypothetical protein